jgi:citrate lyase subunit beta / citryl-CoA lyase
MTPGSAPTPRRFRSLLYAPGDDAGAMEAAAESDADALIFDLEDRVPPDRKARAQSLVREAIERLGRERIIYVRVNAIDSDMIADDLAAVATARLEGVRIPKVESVDDVREADRLLAEAETRAGLVPGSLWISIGLESALAVRSTFDLCSTSPRIASVGPGLGRGGDLERDVGFLPADGIGEETLFIRSMVVLEARAAGVPIPLDGGYGTYRAYDPTTEEAAFLRSAETGRQLGYRAKTCFHAAQAHHINAIFAPPGGSA